MHVSLFDSCANLEENSSKLLQKKKKCLCYFWMCPRGRSGDTTRVVVWTLISFLVDGVKSGVQIVKMDPRLSKHWDVLLFSFAVLSVLHGSAGEIPGRPTTGGGVTVLPPVEPDGPQAYPEPEKDNLPVFTMDYPRIQIPFEITLWVLLASFAKIGFHVYNKITIWVPESCLLISIGLIVGAIMHSVNEEPPAVLTTNVFFLYMLPPIVLDSGYFMPTRPFFENIGTVLWFAVVGTLWNSIGIGMSLFAICQIEAFGVQDINLQENLLFAAIISAVDPVAVLSVFEDVSVNEQLYIVVFGECLFNDAVTVVLYNMFTFVAEMPVVEPVDVFLGVARFFVVGLGGMGFGVLFGFVAAFTTRFTSKVREIEPLFIFMYSYLAYLVAELFAISSIMAIVTCALTMKYYVEENVSQRSCTTIRHVVKMLGSISETLIFFFLGVVTITTEHEWNWGYILFTLLFAFLWRGLGVLVLTQIINPFRTIPFNLKDQFGLAYGGLRGAISFALAFTLPDNIGRKQLFVTATIAIIIFTVFLQGISIRPLIEYINVRRTNRNLDTINAEIHCRLMEHTIAGIEDLCGQWSHFYWKDKFMKFNTRILRRILIRDNRAESSIVALYKKLELQNAMEILDTVSGDISAAPSIVSLHEEKKAPAKPKKKFLAADLRSMHDILAKNMYKIRQRTTSYTSKHALPNDSRTREILIRRHSSIRRSLRPGSFQTAVLPKSHKYFSLPAGKNLDSNFPPVRQRGIDDHETMSEISFPAKHARFVSPSRASSKAALPLRRLDTLEEVPSVDFLDERRARRGLPRTHSSSSEPRRHAEKSEKENEDNGGSSVPPVWAAEPRDGTTRNPLLRRPQWNPKN
ncbi:sodium/hydrogen exchanger 2 isoform X2 [Corythoichthys intestinalis]|uniref:sodium/hydrogen exchanger 2 isoform X2 n=1 Tax=Corythoichthys intestinalis TaxID=161448 RepID=UPI0025A540D5|nr:sodium/hydrogen exchanger 2 isoform X2 [Corythoichthys intestinalis]